MIAKLKAFGFTVLVYAIVAVCIALMAGVVVLSILKDLGFRWGPG
jgi:uncharacterized membrane protein